MADMQAPVHLEFFSGKPTEDPFQWLESFELFIEINQIVGDRVLRFVKHAMREEAYTWFRANQEDIHDWDDCKEAFLERFGLDEDTLMLKLDTCAQQSNETVRSYADRYRKLVGYLQNSLPPRMVTQLFVKGLVPHLRERVQMTYPGNGALADIIRLAANYEQTFGHAPLGGMYINQNSEVPARERNEPWTRRPIDNVDQRAPRPPQQQNQRDNNNNRESRNWPRQRDFPERRNQQPPATPPRQIVPANPPREAPAPPPVNDIDTLTREMERLRIQIAELQRPLPTANFTQFHDDPADDEQPQVRMMYDGFTDPFPVYATKRPAENPPEFDQPLLRRRPNNVQNTTVDPRSSNRPAAPGPNEPSAPGNNPSTTTPPTPAPVPAFPRRAPAPRPHVDLGGLPPLPDPPRPAYRRPPVVPAPSSEPIQQIKGLPMKLTVQSYLNHISEEEFHRSIEELHASREQFLRNKQTTSTPPRAAEAELVVISSDTSDSPSASDTPEALRVQQHLQRNPISTTVATVPIVLNNTIFEEGIIDTGATNTMISQSAARQLGMLNQIEPCRLKYSCADGNMSAPWGIIRKLPVGVDGLIFPIDVFVSGATNYDVLLGTDWLTQAHAEISFAKSEMSYKIDPNLIGKVPITVLPSEKTFNRYCVMRAPVENLGDPEGPEVPALPEVIYFEESTSESSASQDSREEEVSSEDTTSSLSEEEYPDLIEEPQAIQVDFLSSTTADNNLAEGSSLSPPMTNSTEDWMLEKTIFKDIEEQFGPFDFDACCDQEGRNSQLPHFWTPQQDCLKQYWTHKNIYCNPPFSRIDEIVSHCLECFEASPHTTSAVLILPCWPDAPWFSKISQKFHVVKEYPIGSEIAIDIGCSPLGPERSKYAVPWPIIVVSTHAAKRVKDPGLPHLIAVPADAVVHQDNSLTGVPMQPKSAAVQSEVVNLRLPTQPRDEHSLERLQHLVYSMQKPQVDSSHNVSSSPTSPRSYIAHANLSNIIDSDHFGSTFASAKVMCPMLEPAHFKIAPHDSNWSARPSLGWMHKCFSALPRVFEIPTRLVEVIRKGIVLHALKRFKLAYTTAVRMLKNATSIRRKTMYGKKLALKDLRKDGIRKQGAAARVIQPCTTILLDQGSPINDGDAANAVHSESPPQRATDNNTYKVPGSRDEVQGLIPGSVTKDQVCRMQPSQLGSFRYHGYLNKKYATPQRIRASI
jgi:hypothetical protein